jgi:mono/diheme cytochrome c family protein
MLVLAGMWHVDSIARGGDEKAEKKDASVAADVSYYRDIRPIFQEHCQGCHQPAKRGGEYVMTSYKELLKGGESESPAVVPGDLEESYLLLLVTPDEEGKAEMPKEKPALTKAQIEKITAWIKAGARDDTPESAKQKFDAAHPPVYHSPPVITALDFSPDGSLLAVSGYHEVLLHKGDGSELIGRLVGLSERIQSLKFSPDGKRLVVSGGSPARMGEIQIWNVERKELELALTSTYDTLYGASWSHDGTKVAFGCGDNTVRAIDAATGQQVLYQGAHNDWVLDTVFSTDSSHLVSVSRDRSMKLIEVATQRFVDNITSITPGALKGGLAAVDRHPSKDELIVGGADGQPKLFRMYRPADKARQIGDDFNKIRDYEPLPGRVYAAEFNHDGSQFVAGSSNDGAGEIRVYKTDDGKLLAKYDGQPGAVYAATFNHDGSVIAAGGFEGKVYLINPADGKLIKEFLPVPIEKSTQVSAAAGE